MLTAGTDLTTSSLFNIKGKVAVVTGGECSTSLFLEAFTNDTVKLIQVYRWKWYWYYDCHCLRAERRQSVHRLEEGETAQRGMSLWITIKPPYYK